MYREQDQDLKTQLPVVLENFHDNHPLRTGLERGEEGTQQKAKRPRRRARLHGASGKQTLIAAAVAIAMIGGGFAGVRWWVDGRYMVSTDDAYVLAHNTTVASTSWLLGSKSKVFSAWTWHSAWTIASNSCSLFSK